jgi:hypothetical protein
VSFDNVVCQPDVRLISPFHAWIVIADLIRNPGHPVSLNLGWDINFRFKRHMPLLEWIAMTVLWRWRKASDVGRLKAIHFSCEAAV